MWKLYKALKGAQQVLTTVGAVLAAAAIAVESFEVLRKRLRSS